MEVTRNFGANQYLFNCFLSMRDPRVGGRTKHSLLNIITITLCALVSGCDTWKGIELFARERRRWLSQFIDLSEGIPTHYTIARVFALIEPTEFQKCLSDWMENVSALVKGDVISLDGKTQRGSSHIRGNKKANHIINAFHSKEQSPIASIKTPDKSNEIKGIPLLLKMLNIKGMIITIDAMGTQKGIANLIRKKQGNYVLALKNNHKRLYRKVDRLFEQADQRDFQAMVVRKVSTKNYEHSRIEEREYTVLPLMYLHQYKKQWPGLQSFIRVKSSRILSSGEYQTATRYYITSVNFNDYRKACFAIREHWQIENALHYKLDVGLREDECQIFRGHAAENLGYMRKIVLKLLNDENSCDDGIALKRVKAALSTRYLRKVVGF